MNSTVYYKTECGCIKTREQLIKGDQQHQYRLVCPEHHSFIDFKYSYCQQCGAKIICSTIAQKAAKKCIDCNPILGRKIAYARRQATFKKVKATNEQILDALMERSDCIYRPLCSEVHMKDVRLPCYNCKNYFQKNPLDDLVYDIDIEELDIFIKTLLKETNPTKIKSLEIEGIDRWNKIFQKRFKDVKQSLQND